MLEIQMNDKVQIKQKTNVQLPKFINNRTFIVKKIDNKEMMIIGVNVSGNTKGQPMNILGFDYLNKYAEIVILK